MVQFWGLLVLRYLVSDGKYWFIIMRNKVEDIDLGINWIDLKLKLLEQIRLQNLKVYRENICGLRIDKEDSILTCKGGGEGKGLAVIELGRERIQEEYIVR